VGIAYHADKLPGSEHRAESAEKYLIALGVPIARSGYQIYKARELQPSGVEEIDRLPPETSVPVYRDEKDVFDPVALSTFEGKSITKLHPPAGFLTPENDREFAKGHVQNVRGPVSLPNGEKAVIADLWVKDAQLIQYIKDHTMEEISCGYRYKLEPLDGEEYGYRMTNIVGNHVAIVPSGRAGDYVRVLDASPKGEEGMDFKEVVESLKTLGLRIIGDSESEAVTMQKKKDAEALQLKSRVMDAEEEKKEKEEKAANDKRMKDSEEKIEEVSKKQEKLKEAVDAGFKMLKDAFEEMKKDKEKKAEDAKCNCDAEEGAAHKESCPMFKKEGEDADLIPSPTLHGTEVPKNPIPGADALQLVNNLRQLRPLIADSGDKVAIAAFNRTMAAAKSRKPANDADYAVILQAASSMDKDARSKVHLTGDSRKGLEPGSYQEMMRDFNRKNQSEWKMPSSNASN
jgi:hypothetical protein